MNRFKMTPMDLMSQQSEVPKQMTERRKPPAVKRRGSNYVPSMTTDFKRATLKGGSNSAMRAAKRLNSSAKRNSMRNTSKESNQTKSSDVISYGRSVTSFANQTNGGF